MAIPVVAESEFMTGKSLRSQTCGMEYNASVVKAMTATLYDYKIEAVVREYSTNITDSHTDAGFPEKKGYVHVPTKLNPVIEFHDKGVGMDEDTIYSVYTVLGCSTKREDNSTNGSLGFGSKSYAAVADQMTVTSVKDGIKVVVICYKNKYGELAADLKSKTKVDEENGTIVSIPVKTTQVEEWQEACARVLGAFRVPHDVNTFGCYQDEYDLVLSVCAEARNNDSVFIQTPEYELLQHRSNTLVLMGDVLYHLPDFDNLIAKTKLKTVASSMVDKGFYVTHFDIGDLDHAPSREAISYDQQTLTKVRLRINQDIKKEYHKFQAEFGVHNIDSMSLYKFYHKYYNTAVWDVLKDMCFPFTGGVSLNRINPHSYSYYKVMPLLGLGLGKIRGFVPTAQKNVTFSYCVEALSQERILNISSPLIVFSENEKGLYKMRDTLQNILNSTEYSHILYAESEELANKLLDWFGCGKVLCGDAYSPEKPICNKIVRTRESFGIKNDWETVASVLTLREDGYSLKQEKVNLKEKGVYFATGNILTLKGIVKGTETKVDIDTNKSRSLLRLCGVQKVVFMNKNNQGKIKRSGLQPVDRVLVNFIKTNKQDIIKQSVWTEVSLDLYSKEKLLARNTKPYTMLQNKLLVKDPVVETIIHISDFGLKGTKLYQKHAETKRKLLDSIKQETYTLKSKLPLFDKLSNSIEMEDMKHYLRLEKVIK